MKLAVGSSGGPVAPWFGIVQPWIPHSGISMLAAPSRLRPSTSTLVTFTGIGTTWTSAAPSLSAAGVAGVSIGTVTVHTDTSCSGTVTTGAATGTVTWTDATSGATATQSVGLWPRVDPFAVTATVLGPDPSRATLQVSQ